MSYLDNNPFNRPTPNFATNINTFNTYSSNDYLNTGTTSKSPYTYDTNYTPGARYDTYGGYFGKVATNSKAEEYKYSRAVEDSPFITGTNPFAMSNVGQQRTYSSSASSFYQQHQRPSNESDRRQYTYEARISSTSGFTDPYQQPYFKGDKYEQKFRKSTFEANFELQLGKSRENEADTRYKNSSKEVELSSLLANNPFRKGTLQSSKEQPYKPSDYDIKRHDNYNTPEYTTISDTPNRYGPSHNNYQLPKNEYQPYSNEKISSNNDYNPITTNTNDLINAFKSSSRYNSQSQSQKNEVLVMYQNDDDELSQKGSRNTFINKMNDVISDVGDDDQNGVRVKKMDNPFARGNKMFGKDKVTMGKAEDGRNSQLNKVHDYYDQRRSSDAGSIRFEDFIDIGNGNGNVNVNANNMAKQQSQDSKYDKYIFKKSSIVADSFESKHDELYGSKASSKASTRKKVYEQFQWSSKGGSKANVEVDDQVNTETRKMVLGENNKLVESLSYDKTASDKIHMRGSKARYEHMKESLESNKQPVMKRSLQRDQVQLQQLQPGLKMQNQMKYSLTGQLKTSLTADHKTTLSRQPPNPFSKQQSNPFSQYNSKPIKTTQQFKFAKQHFADEQDDDDQHQNYQYQAQRKRQSEYSLKRISEANQSAERESDPNFSKRQSRASLTQKNTEQEIDQKLEKYRYTYQKQTDVRSGQDVVTRQVMKQVLTHSQQLPTHVKTTHNNEPMLHDFMDMQMDDSYHEDSSFQAAYINDHNQQLTTPQHITKSNNLKSRVVNSLKNDSLHQELQKDVSTYGQKVVDSKSSEKMKNIIKESPQTEKYEFQALEQFQARYKMKGSGFDFDQDEFEETEKQLGFQDDNDIDNCGHNNVLVAQYGYDHHQQVDQHENNNTKQPTSKLGQTIQADEVHSPHRSYISSISSSSNIGRDSHLKEDDYVLPSFNIGMDKINQGIRSSLNQRQRQREVKDSNIGERLSQKREIRKDGVNVNTGEIQKQKNSQVKVHRVKIYESEGDEPFRSSGEYGQYTSPFQKAKQKTIPAQQRVIPINLNNNQTNPIRLSFGNDNNYAYDQEMQRSEVKLFSSSNHEQNQQNYRNQADMDEFSQQDLADTVKHVTRHSQRESNRIRPNIFAKPTTPPVRDSFEFSMRGGNVRNQQHKQQHGNANKQSRQHLYNKQHPRTVQLRGSIYHLIELM